MMFDKTKAKVETRIAILSCLAILTSGCSLGAAAARMAMDETAKSTEGPKAYSEAPPGEPGANPEIEAQALRWAQSDTETRIDYRWSTLASGWSAVREEDRAGNQIIVGQRALVWVGGPVKKAKEGADSQPGDCVYFLITAYKEHMGGGNYGETTTGWSTYQPNYEKLRCQDAKALEAATPAGQETGAPLEVAGTVQSK